MIPEKLGALLRAATLAPLLAAFPALSRADEPAAKVDFERQVLPIFKRNCLACHNATDAQGDLVMETPATIAKGGENGAVVDPAQRCGEPSAQERDAGDQAIHAAEEQQSRRGDFEAG